MAVPSWTEAINSMYVTTLQLRRPKIIDQIMRSTPLWLLLNKKGHIEHEQGGRFIQVDLKYAKNETIQFIGKGQHVEIKSSDPLTAGQYDWKYLTGHITRYFVDFQQNRGPAAVKKRINVDIDNLTASMIQLLEERLFSDGTDDAGKSIDGLGNLVATSPTTGTVGGLNRATYAWWRNQVTSMSGEDVSTYLLRRMRSMFNTCGSYSDGAARFPDLIITTQSVYEAYEEECLELGRILMPDKDMMDLGFGELAFKGRPITWSPSCPSGTMRFVNSEHLKMVVDSVENMTLGEWIPIHDQPRDFVAHAMWVGNLVMDNARKQGVIHSIVPT